jgi:hypothetical protein
LLKKKLDKQNSKRADQMAHCLTHLHRRNNGSSSTGIQKSVKSHREKRSRGIVTRSASCCKRTHRYATRQRVSIHDIGLFVGAAGSPIRGEQFASCLAGIAFREIRIESFDAEREPATEAGSQGKVAGPT